MATPAVSAVAAIFYCDGVSDFQAVKDSVLNCSKDHNDLTAIAMDGNVLYFDAACLTTVGNFELENDFQYSIYPNPANERIYISPNQKMEDVKIQLINMSGQAVFQKEINYWEAKSIQQFDVKKLPSGIYFFKIQFSSYIWTYKIIKT